MDTFSLEGPLYQFMVRFWDLVKLNVLWLIFSLPLVTLGASTVAAYSVTLTMVENRDTSIVKQFLAGFIDNWKQGIPLGIIHLTLVYLVYLNLEFFNKLPDAPVFFLIAAMIVGFFCLVTLTYAYALCARYRNTLMGTLRNSAAMAMKYFVMTLGLWVILSLLIGLFLFNRLLLFMGLLIGPVSIFLTTSGFALRIFKQIDIDNGYRTYH
jgi:uncharacterized membrane protein YesL